MKSIPKHIVYLLLLMVCLSSCAVNNSQITEVILPESSPAIKAPKDFTISTFVVQTPNNIDYFDFIQTYTRNNIKEFLKRSEIIEAQERKIRSARSWRESHIIAQNFANEIPQLHLSFDVHQNLASAMLYYVLLEEEPTVEVQKAIEYYLNILLEYKNYQEANILARSLIKLQGFWSDDKISNLSNEIINDYTKRVGHKSDMVNLFFQYYTPLLQKNNQAKYSNMTTSQITENLHSNYKQRIQQRLMPEFASELDARKNPRLRVGLENYYGMAVLQILASEQSNIIEQK
jgi:hypothetical protein